MHNKQRIPSARKLGNQLVFYVKTLLLKLHVSSRILKEFEKAKPAYEESLAAAKLSSQSKLREQLKQLGDNASVNEEEIPVVDVEAPLKTIVNEFLADPVNFKAETVPPKIQSIQEAVEEGHDGASVDTKSLHRAEEHVSVRLNSSLNYSLFSQIFTVFCRNCVGQ